MLLTFEQVQTMLYVITESFLNSAIKIIEENQFRLIKKHSLEESIARLLAFEDVLSEPSQNVRTELVKEEPFYEQARSNKIQLQASQKIKHYESPYGTESKHSKYDTDQEDSQSQYCKFELKYQERDDKKSDSSDEGTIMQQYDIQDHLIQNGNNYQTIPQEVKRKQPKYTYKDKGIRGYISQKGKKKIEDRTYLLTIWLIEQIRQNNKIDRSDIAQKLNEIMGTNHYHRNSSKINRYFKTHPEIKIELIKKQLYLSQRKFKRNTGNVWFDS